MKPGIYAEVQRRADAVRELKRSQQAVERTGTEWLGL